MNIECHCGNIKIKADYSPKELTICNCSICRRYNSLWGYYQPTEVGVDIGESGSSSYLWNDKCIEFVHCNRCGCITHYQTLPGDSSPRMAINFRMANLDEIRGIHIRHFNGADM